MRRVRPAFAAAAALFALAAAAGPAAAQSRGAGDALSAELLRRLDATQADIRRLTAQVEQLEFRLREQEAQAAARQTDLEMRVIELEGGDPTAALAAPAPAAPTPLPPTAPPPPAAPQTATPAPGLAPGPQPLGTLRREGPSPAERATFDAAAADLARGGVDQGLLSFQSFIAAHPGSPLIAEAHHLLGAALQRDGRHQEAARQFFVGYRDHAEAPFAPNNLLGLGEALVSLGRFEEACGALTELAARYPTAPPALAARADAAESRASCR